MDFVNLSILILNFLKFKVVVPFISLCDTHPMPGICCAMYKYSVSYLKSIIILQIDAHPHWKYMKSPLL